jgi:hypothetical protein
LVIPDTAIPNTHNGGIYSPDLNPTITAEWTFNGVTTTSTGIVVYSILK